MRVLQLGTEDLTEKYPAAECAEWSFEPDLRQKPDRPWDMVILDREIDGREKEYLQKNTKAYCLFVTDRINMEEGSCLQQLYRCKMGKRLPVSDLGRFLSEEPQYYFPNSYGDQMLPTDLEISGNFRGKIHWDGFWGTVLEGDFGNDFTQIAFWRYNIPISYGQCLEFWPEYSKDAGIEVELRETMFAAGEAANILETQVFTEEDLREPVCVENNHVYENSTDAEGKHPGRDGWIFMALWARGKGCLQIRTLHQRFSRKGRGAFLPGGLRLALDTGEEAFFYFDPGDRKPPLNIYFAGYKTKEGFEGYGMMRGKGAPFLLISEPRLEGGNFYMGSPGYEQMIEDQIYLYMKELGFDNSQVIMSGLSMGTYGALLYSCRIIPHAVILGKPVASLGELAERERIWRPGGFPSSLDVLRKYGGGMEKENMERLNKRFWDRFDAADWKNTQFAVAYMIEDDCDMTAYGKLLMHLDGTGVLIFGKGLHGRHNDDTEGIVRWFTAQYSRIMKEDYGRT